MRAQNSQLRSADSTPRPPLPELLDARSREPLDTVIPKLKMQFHRERDLRIEEIATPLPAGTANQRGQVIRRKPLQPFHWLVPAGNQRVAGRVHHRGRRIEIDVVLAAILR